MGYTAAPLEKLIEEFSKFPGIGRKGATRMAYQVLSMSDEDAAALAGAIQGAHTKLHRCRICQNYTEADICPICASAKRDPSVICVVETPRDVQAFERDKEYRSACTMCCTVCSARWTELLPKNSCVRQETSGPARAWQQGERIIMA